MESNRTIEDIAYLIKQAKDKDENKPIIFLGAGASASAGIPLVGEIIQDILELHKDKPSIKRLTEEQKKDYYKLMSALSAQERRNLFYNYINNEKVKLNVTHIYLAQMLNEGLIDYILTSNFDDLMLKACAMFNFIPPVYDISILNDFTTTTFLEKSVTYLHGQHHGQWLLNAEGELTKVKDAIPKIFERICNNRTWIVVGYSGEDELLNEIAKIGSFENDLYWIGYNNNPLSEKVKEKLFSNPRTNAYHIKGHDSDSFFLTLHSELKLKTPEIFNKPFSFLQTMMNQVTDIQVEDNEHKSLFSNIKERKKISENQVIEAIQDIEKRDDENHLTQQIIEKYLKSNFSEEDSLEFEKEILENNYAEVKYTLSEYYRLWGQNYSERSIKEKNKNIFDISTAKFKKALELYSKNTNVYTSSGKSLFDWGKLQNDSNYFDKGLLVLEEGFKLGGDAYNLSCAYSIMNNKGKALKYLSLSLKKDQIFIESINGDQDWDYYRDDPDFKNTLEKYRIKQ